MTIDENEINELLDYFGSAENMALSLGLEISRIRRAIEAPSDITAVERSLLSLLVRALRSKLIDFLIVDRILIGLEEPEASAPASLVTLSNVHLYELLENQCQLIELQRLIIEYYQENTRPAPE